MFQVESRVLSLLFGNHQFTSSVHFFVLLRNGMSQQYSYAPLWTTIAMMNCIDDNGVCHHRSQTVESSLQLTYSFSRNSNPDKRCFLIVDKIIKLNHQGVSWLRLHEPKRIAHVYIQNGKYDDILFTLLHRCLQNVDASHFVFTDKILLKRIFLHIRRTYTLEALILLPCRLPT